MKTEAYDKMRGIRKAQSLSIGGRLEKMRGFLP